MPPRKTTEFGALFESLVEDLRIQVAASVDRTLSDLSRRIARLERRLDAIDPNHASCLEDVGRRNCSLCERTAVARGLCSAHYQQWRYRERRAKIHEEARERIRGNGFVPQLSEFRD
jgi:hypothetical protein